MRLADYSLASLILLATFAILAVRRIDGAIGSYAFQSFALAGISLLLFVQAGAWELLILAMATLAIKGVTIPAVLRRQLGPTIYATRESRYYVGFPSALLLGSAATLMGFLAGVGMPRATGQLGQTVVGIALAVILTGFLSATMRREAPMQLTGLLVAENGLVLLALALAPGLPLLVDFAFVLDVLIGAMVMGFLIARIHANFATTDTSELTRLRG